LDIIGLIPAFGGVAYTLVAFVIALSVIVAIHEYGHYIVGRWCGIHAEVFSLGMGPVLWSRVDRRGTKWQLAALPFGGYVKFLGDADAASGKDAAAIAAMDPAERRHTMHSAPLWARSATVAAGPVFNFVLSFLIFAAVLLGQGETREPLGVDSLRPLPNASLGIEEGDDILAINGQTVTTFAAFGAVLNTLTPTPTVDYLVRRGGDETTVEGPWPYPAHVVGLSPQSAAFDINMQVGDVITSVNGTPVFAFSQLREFVEGSNGDPLELKVWRAGETLDFVLVPRRVDEPQPDGGFETNWRIGIAGGLFFEPATETPGIGAALSYGVTQTVFIVQSSLSGLWNMITGAISSCNLSGPIGIAQASGAMASQGTTSFIWFIAVLSTAVGLLNLFPIPILDGGHLVFHAYEAVTGKPPSDKALRVLMTIGLTLILSLMVFAVTNDLFCP
jgi:regulator of sigma E protease